MGRRRGRGKRVACRVGSGNRDIEAVISSEIGPRDRDTEGIAGADGTGVIVAVDGETDRIARGGVAADRAGHVDVAAGFGRVDDVVGGDVIHANRRRC